MTTPEVYRERADRLAEIARLAAAKADAEREASEAAAALAETIRHALDVGVPAGDAAVAAELSRQRVYQIRDDAVTS